MLVAVQHEDGCCVEGKTVLPTPGVFRDGSPAAPAVRASRVPVQGTQQETALSTRRAAFVDARLLAAQAKTTAWC